MGNIVAGNDGVKELGNPQSISDEALHAAVARSDERHVAMVVACPTQKVEHPVDRDQSVAERVDEDSGFMIDQIIGPMLLGVTILMNKMTKDISGSATLKAAPLARLDGKAVVATGLLLGGDVKGLGVGDDAVHIEVDGLVFRSHNLVG